jgi:hypothetical protein
MGALSSTDAAFRAYKKPTYAKIYAHPPLHLLARGFFRLTPLRFCTHWVQWNTSTTQHEQGETT